LIAFRKRSVTLAVEQELKTVLTDSEWINFCRWLNEAKPAKGVRDA